MASAENSDVEANKRPSWAGEAQHFIDASGLNCPMPLLKLKMALAQAAPGEVVCLISTDTGSKVDVPAYAKLAKLAIWIESDGQSCRFWLRKPD